MVTTLLLTYSGLTSLCLAMNRHHVQMWNRAPPATRARWLRAVGASLLTLALLAACSNGRGWPVAIVEWLAALTAATLLLGPAMAQVPRLAGALALLAAPSGVLILILG